MINKFDIVMQIIYYFWRIPITYVFIKNYIDRELSMMVKITNWVFRIRYSNEN